MPPTTAARRSHTLVNLSGTHAKGNAGQPSKNKARIDDLASRLVPPSRPDVDSVTESDSETEDDDEDVQANLEMDGQDLWAQNYCSVCDCLIEPGSGVGSRRPSSAAAGRPGGETASSAVATGAFRTLRGKTGTIKARPPSSDGPAPPNGATPAYGQSHRMKRSSSGGSSRLNALSELKPTTKLSGDVKSSKTDRQFSNVSNKSSTAACSGEETPVSPSGSTLLRCRKGGLLGGLTPAALKQQEQEAMKAKAPPALYCSERCRDIDEQRQLSASGMAELSTYVSQQPYSLGVASPLWQGQLPGLPEIPRAWPRPLSMTSLPAAFAQLGLRTPESESSSCVCPDCLEKHSGSGTVPSGASDTTEGSSIGFPYARSGAARKQRTQSGRILTPQNLIPPGAGANDDGYFPSPSFRPFDCAEGHNVDPPARTSSVASGESSTRSSESCASLWEPQLSKRNDADVYEIHSSQQSRMSMLSERSGTTMMGLHGAATPEARSQHGSLATRPSSVAGSLHKGINPLLLLRNTSSDARQSLASVDLSAEQAGSPGGSRLAAAFGSSLNSEQTLGTSAHTLVQRESSLRERRNIRGRSLALDLHSVASQQYIHADGSIFPLNRGDEPASRLSQSLAGPRGDALATLRAAAHSQAGNRTNVDEARRCSSSSTLSTGWLQSLSSAWCSLRQGSMPQLVFPEAQNDLAKASDAKKLSTPGLRSDSLSPNSGGPQGRAIDSRKWSKTSSSSDQASSSALSRSAASESLSRMLSAANLSSLATAPERKGEAASVARPGASRGSVPAFASEIGHGRIPGEAADVDRASTGSIAPLDDEERRRRRKAEVRHQRSKDVTMLPPLLAPSSRPGSALNLAQQWANSYANLHVAPRNRSKTRSSVSSNSGPTFIIGSAGSFPDFRPQTPGLANGMSNAPIDEGVAHLPRTSSQSDVSRSGTSPRRVGFGWSAAMTPIQGSGTNALRSTMSTSSSSSEHLHSRSFGHGRYNAHHHHHQHHHQYQQYRSGQLHGRHAHHHSVHAGGLTLGHIGVLGTHPHGSQPAYGRHNTMPVRTSTPIVPEDGGEMSGAALTGQDVDEPIHRPFSSMSQRRLSSRASSQGPPRPQSSVAYRAADTLVMSTRHSSVADVAPSAMVPAPMAPPVRMWSYDNIAKAGERGIKTYPVLHLPGRQQTHDRYNDAWTETMDLIAGDDHRRHAHESQEASASVTTTTRRKQLFHFG